MARKIISSNWDRETRNYINENYKELYDDIRDLGISTDLSLEDINSRIDPISPLAPDDHLNKYPIGYSLFYDTQDTETGLKWADSTGLKTLGGFRLFVETVKFYNNGATYSAIQRVHFIETYPNTNNILATYKRGFYESGSNVKGWGDYIEIDKMTSSEDINIIDPLSVNIPLSKYPRGMTIFYDTQDTETGSELYESLGISLSGGFRFMVSTLVDNFFNTYAAVQKVDVIQTSPNTKDILVSLKRSSYGFKDDDNWGPWTIEGYVSGIHVMKEGSDVLNKDNIQNGRYYRFSDGQLMYNNLVNGSGFIPVVNGAKYFKELPGHVTYFDENLNYVVGYNIQDPTEITIPYGPIRFMYFSFNRNDSDKASLIYKGGGLKNGEVIISPDRLILPTDNKTREVSTEANSLDFLRIPTPYDDGENWIGRHNQATHPSIYNFDKNWNGYKYWLAFTPYPKSLLSSENPCIVASNDGVKWDVPNGVVNPLDEAPSGGYNSDTHILFNDKTNELEIWYRAVTENSSVETIKRVTSSDGSNWSDPEVMLESRGAPNILQYISPSVMWYGGIYVMYVMRDWFIGIITSLDGKNWNNDITWVLDEEGDRIHSWHPNIQLIDGVFYMTNCEKMTNQGDGGELYYHTSKDGLTWSKGMKILSFTGNDWDYDGHGVYRSTMMFRDGNIFLYYGMFQNSPKGRRWTIGLSTGRDVHNLKGIDSRVIDFYS